ncbi:oxidoreductase-like domain-containing protein 1 [Argonauta hians]
MPVHRLLSPSIRTIGAPLINISKEINHIQDTCLHIHNCGCRLVLSQAFLPNIKERTNQLRGMTSKTGCFNTLEKGNGTNVINNGCEDKESLKDTTSVQIFHKDKKLNENSELEDHINKVSKLPPDPPTDCCMSGCANCVWITYAEEMKKYYCSDGVEKALKEIEAIEDVSLKAFLKVELSFLKD